MYFKRFPRHTVRTASPQRLAAARRQVKRDRDSVALFPELARDASPEARIERQEAESAEYWQGLRDSCARDWRKARALLRQFPVVAAVVLPKWNTRFIPGQGHYLCGLIRAELRRSAPRCGQPNSAFSL